MINFQVTKRNITKEHLSDSYCVDILGGDTFPLTYRKIDKYQRKEKDLAAKLKHKNYHTKSFCGGGIITQLICRSDNIVRPKTLRNYVVNWYHTYLLHTGMDRTEATIIQN